ncbi:MAG: hypothetical protein AMJ59_20575, partial [Gammaproteobacteria bacterium SG8_31]
QGDIAFGDGRQHDRHWIACGHCSLNFRCTDRGILAIGRSLCDRLSKLAQARFFRINILKKNV